LASLKKSHLTLFETGLQALRAAKSIKLVPSSAEARNFLDKDRKKLQSADPRKGDNPLTGGFIPLSTGRGLMQQHRRRMK
jgi:hypothetical protein